jgi:hypothetical protein
VWLLGGLKKTPQRAPGEHRAVGGSQRTPGHTCTRGMGLTRLTTGPAGVGGHGSTLWVFWNKSALRADLRVFQSVGCRALGGVAPRGPQKDPSAGPWGASCRRGVTKDPRPHLHKGHGLDSVDDGTRWRGRARLDVMGFLEQVRTSCGPQGLSKRRMPGLGGCGSSGASKRPLSGPLGSIVPSGGHKGPPATPAQGAWA